MAGAISWPAGRTSIVVKLPLRLRAGAFVWVPEATPLSVDLVGDDGRLLYPSDFVPFKPRCDVIVLGEPPDACTAPAEVALGTWRCRAAVREQLGPRDTFCAGGDPTTDAALAVWGQPGFDFSRFQAASPGWRIPWPVSPFWVEYKRGGVHVAGSVKMTSPRALILNTATRKVLSRIALVLDTVLLDPAQSGLTLVFRGLFDRTSASAGADLLALDLEDVPAMDGRATVRWLPTTLATLAPEARSPNGAVAAPSWEDATSPVIRPHAMTLPFAGRGGPGRRAPLTPGDLASLRDQGRRRVEGASAVGSETKLVRSPAAWADPPPAFDPPPSSAGAPRSAPTSQTAPISDEQRVLSIRQEIWRGEQPASRILARHGLDEAAWRALKRGPGRPT